MAREICCKSAGYPSESQSGFNIGDGCRQAQRHIEEDETGDSPEIGDETEENFKYPRVRRLNFGWRSPRRRAKVKTADNRWEK